VSLATFILDAATKEELEAQLLKLYEDMRREGFWLEHVSTPQRRWVTTVRITDNVPAGLDRTSKS
jgi:hypothetical protein